jgi:DNA-directed RNA polymerase subunit beta
MEPGVPESFNVLIRELQSLCLDVELIKAGERKPVLSASPGGDGFALAQKSRGALMEAD